MWWRPNARDARVAGVLSAGYDNLSLELIGSFEGIEGLASLAAYPVLHGTTTSGKHLTLINSSVGTRSFSFGSLDIPSTLLLPAAVLVGGHLDDPLTSVWDASSIELERLTAWAEPHGLAQSLQLTEERRLASASFGYEVPPSVERHIPGAAVTIGPTQRLSTDLVHEARITVSVTARFTFEKPATIDDIQQRYLKPLLDLVIFATQKPTSILAFRVSCRSPRAEVEVVQRRDPPTGDERKRLSPADALFLLPDPIDVSPDALDVWYRAAGELERPFDLVFAVRSRPTLFLEHRLLNVVQAAERYHEVRLGGAAMTEEVWERVVAAATDAAGSPELARQLRDRMATVKKPSLRTRIEDLLTQGGDPLRGLLVDPGTLARRASRLRNDLSHGNVTDDRHREVFDTSEELLLVLEFCFLRELGLAPTDAAVRLRRASRSYSGLWLRRREDSAGGNERGSTSP
jgi:hypothetical protein